MAQMSIGSYTRDARDAIRQIEQQFKKFSKLMNEATEGAVTEALLLIQERSQYYTPVLNLAIYPYHKANPGDLLNSHYVVVERTSKGMQGEVGVGRDGFPEYTVFVHEIPRHHAEPTQYKFLQRAIQERIDYIPIVIEDFMSF